MHPSTKFITIALLLQALITGSSTDCYAETNRPTQRHSKDFKRFPAGSPEAVVTKFIESDFEDSVDRALNLTETGHIPICGYPRLFIKSYKIVNKVIDPKNGEVTVNLALDVRAVHTDGNRRPEDTCSKKIILVNDEKCIFSGIKNTKEFIETIINGKVSSSYNNFDYYFLPANKRKWVLPVRMVRKRSQWLIENGSIPLLSIYISSEIASHKAEILKYKAINDVCSGKLPINQYVSRKLQLDYATTEIGTNLKRFKAECCRKHDIDYRIITISEIMDSLKDFEKLEKE
jgi:hypothetical protein